MQRHLVFLCYGSDSISRELVFALLSLSSCFAESEIPDFDVWIYTDRPLFFEQFKDCPFSMQYREIDSETIRKWRGAIDFTHRVKIEALLDFTTRESGTILYCDTDVIFCRKVALLFDAIDEGNNIMHIPEGRVNDASNPILTKLNKHLAQKPMPGYGDLTQMTMWNAGVLGFKASQREHLKKTLEFTDTLYPHFSKHIAEQFAFSVILSRDGALKAAAADIIHYWNLKEVRILLDDFFAHYAGASWKDIELYSKNINIPALLQQKANFYRNRSLAGKILKQQWLPDVPDWKAQEAYA